MLNKLFILLLKYIPIIQMVGMLINNILYTFHEINDYMYIIDFIIGNSIITTFLLFICSYVFRFCNWYRYIIITNFINIIISFIDSTFYINIDKIELFVIMNIINAIGIIISLYNKLIKGHEKCIK